MPKVVTTALISTGAAARLLGLSVERVRQLDNDLRPELVSGRRAYRRDRVEQLARERARMR